MLDSTNLPEVDINQIATDLNGKMDRDGVNASCPVVISRTPNSQGGVVEIWSDGYCVQSGLSAKVPGSGTLRINLDQPYKDTNYTIFMTPNDNDTQQPPCLANQSDRHTTYFLVDYQSASYTTAVFWETKGYIR